MENYGMRMRLIRLFAQMAPWTIEPIAVSPKTVFLAMPALVTIRNLRLHLVLQNRKPRRQLRSHLRDRKASYPHLALRR